MLDTPFRKNVVTTLALMLTCCEVNNVSIVYNMKLSEITKRFQQSSIKSSGGKEDYFGATATVITQMRKTYNDIHQKTIAGLGTIQYSPGSWYVALETAAGHVKNTFPIEVNLVKENTQVDDLLFSAGYAIGINGHTRITFSGLLGVPVHRDVTLLGAQFGTGHVGLGAQLDLAYAYTDDLDHTMLAAARYVRFLSREAEACINQQSRCFDVTLGNLVDALFASNHRWGHHHWEFGYDATFAFGAHVQPSIPAIDEDQFTFLRSTFYTTYAYTFPIGDHPSGFLFGFSVGTDHRPVPLGFKRLLAGWITWGIKF